MARRWHRAECVAESAGRLSAEPPPRIAQGVYQQASVAVVVYALEVLACLQNDIFAAAVLSQPQSADFTADFFDAWLGHNGDLTAFQQLSGWLNFANAMAQLAGCQRAARQNTQQPIQAVCRRTGCLASGGVGATGQIAQGGVKASEFRGGLLLVSLEKGLYVICSG